MSTLKFTLCRVCVVLAAFRWAETDCSECDQLNASLPERIAA